MPTSTHLAHNYLVVGDKFSNLADIFENVVTETMVIDMLQFAPLPLKPIAISFGQGVNQDMVEMALSHRISEDAGAEKFFKLYKQTCLPRAVKRLAHKAEANNILVCTPIPSGRDYYRLDLHFNTSNEFFADHMTGLHIPGMALTEAARQAFLVVTELYYLADKKEKQYFVIKSMESRFISFVFPLEAHIEYKVIKSNIKHSYASFEVEMSLIQADKVCAEFSVSFTVFEDKHISLREVEIFRDRLNFMFKNNEKLPYNFPENNIPIEYENNINMKKVVA